VEELSESNPWYEWGPYLSERAWGTVREDYSDNGDAWSFFPMIIRGRGRTDGTDPRNRR
jgi:hypothetical protein